MEGEPQIPSPIDGDEEFYEKIEAPKFVDFTAPDRSRPDDKFWFCLRVGCDRKHEEEIDHEAISKDFVLRVMAARSPNVRLRKVLNRKASSIKDKCPLSAPAKPTKARLSKIAVISSISQKIIDTKAKTKPLSKLPSTPKLPKGKQVAAKYLTTPRHKVCPSNTSKSFQSVQNPRPTNIVVPQNKIVAKALFRSPKKGICVKTSAELRTPLTKICEGIKKLDITSQRKRVLGYSSKSSKETSRRNVCEDKSKVSSSLRPSNTKEQKSKSIRGLKRENNYNLDKVIESTPKGAFENESSDMEIEKKSRISNVNNTNTDLADADDSSTVKFKEGNEVSEGNLEVKTEPLEMRADLEDKPTKSENLEIGDKENALAPDHNRSCRKNLLEKSGTKIEKKVVKTQDINLKEGLKKSAATDAQVKKYKTPKPTNPKPFRLRTDERGVLREANIEKRAPLKETEAVLTLPSGVLDKKENESEKQTRSAERSNGDPKIKQKVQNTTTPRRRPNLTTHRENESSILGEISGKDTRETKSPSLQPHFMMPIGGISKTKTIGSKVKIGDKLTVIKETSSAEAGDRIKRSVSKGKKSTTSSAKETNVPGIHIQKNCARKVS